MCMYMYNIILTQLIDLRCCWCCRYSHSWRHVYINFFKPSSFSMLNVIHCICICMLYPSKNYNSWIDTNLPTWPRLVYARILAKVYPQCLKHSNCVCVMAVDTSKPNSPPRSWIRDDPGQGTRLKQLARTILTTHETVANCRINLNIADVYKTNTVHFDSKSSCLSY